MKNRQHTLRSYHMSRVPYETWKTLNWKYLCKFVWVFSKGQLWLKSTLFKLYKKVRFENNITEDLIAFHFIIINFIWSKILSFSLTSKRNMSTYIYINKKTERNGSIFGLMSGAKMQYCDTLAKQLQNTLKEWYLRHFLLFLLWVKLSLWSVASQRPLRLTLFPSCLTREEM